MKVAVHVSLLLEPVHKLCLAPARPIMATEQDIRRSTEQDNSLIKVTRPGLGIPYLGTSKRYLSFTLSVTEQIQRLK
jgi:hypothetical protein